jgi:hypothetical protein
MSDVSTLTIQEKAAILSDVILPLRNYQLLGILETRNWIELLFPEFGEIRDREADAMFEEMARIKAGIRDVDQSSELG